MRLLLGKNILSPQALALRPRAFTLSPAEFPSYILNGHGGIHPECRSRVEEQCDHSQERLYGLCSMVDFRAGATLGWQLIPRLGSGIPYFTVDDRSNAPPMVHNRGMLKVNKESHLQIVDAGEDAHLLMGLRGIEVSSGDYFRLPEGVPIGITEGVRKAVVIKSNPFPMFFGYGYRLMTECQNGGPRLLVAGALSMDAIPSLSPEDYRVNFSKIHYGELGSEIHVDYAHGRSIQIHRAEFKNRVGFALRVKKRMNAMVSLQVLSGVAVVEAGGLSARLGAGLSVQIPIGTRNILISGYSIESQVMMITPARTSTEGAISTSIIRSKS